jgi:protein disulfide-isomerase
MKTFLSLLMTVALTSMAFAAKEGWLDDLEKAKAQAKSENKKILLDFTGSDWCGWCKKLDAEVFSQQASKDYAAKHLVLVEVDFPRSFQLPEATKKQNDELAKKFKIQAIRRLSSPPRAGRSVESWVMWRAVPKHSSSN